MKIIPSYYEILYIPDGIEMLKRIEAIARVSYKSEAAITDDSYKVFVKKLIDSHHDSCLEHGGLISVMFTTDRGVTHEAVRHRLASFNQESTRFANYSKDRFGKEITVVIPTQNWKSDKSYGIWRKAMEYAEASYMQLLGEGETPQIARSVLPTALKSDLVITANPREWRHIFSQRCSKAAHPQIRELMISLLDDFIQLIPILFDDLGKNLTVE